MSGNLFSAFTASDKAAWQKQAEKEVRGPITQLNLLNISDSEPVDAYTTATELESGIINDLQSSQKKAPGWLNMPLTKTGCASKTNTKIHAALNAGAQAIILEITDTDTDKYEFYKLLNGVRLCDTPVYIRTKQDPVFVFDAISKGAGYYLKGGIANDPVANWMRSGKAYEESITNVAEVLNKTKNMREFHPFMVESHVFHRSGATPVQELAAMTGTMVCYLDQLTDLGIPVLLAVNRFFFSVSVGTEYLTEIAKLRALRYLYKKVCRAYELPDALCNAFIHTETSSFYDSASVPHTNMIRAASEAMSAITGGCDALTVRAYDESFSDANDFSDRIARNVSLLIANESYLNQVADPAAGSFFIENLSLKLADAAWSLFLKWEEAGGIVQSFKAGLIQNEIEKAWKEKVTALNNDRVMVGVNKFTEEHFEHNPEPVPDFFNKNKTNGLRLLTERNLAREWNKHTFSGEDSSGL